jgi:nitronate monooxygenase
MTRFDRLDRSFEKCALNHGVNCRIMLFFAQNYSMWKDTRITKLLGISYPIFQGPFGGNLSSVKLAAIVSNLGGVGGFGAYSLTPDEIVHLDKALKTETNKPYNINLWVSDSDVAPGGVGEERLKLSRELLKPFFDELDLPLPDQAPSFSSRFENQVEVILDKRPPVFSFMFGIPSADILEQCKRRGITTIGAATTIDEAVALDDAGVDCIIASGFEAGGHRPSFMASSETSLTGTFVLLQQLKEKVKKPVIAAGGIATGNGIAAAMALGAEAVQVGTAFLACEESNASIIHRQMLFSDEARHTVLTRAFTGRLGRGLQNRLSEEMRGKEMDFLPFPLQTQLMSTLRAAAIDQQKWEMVFFWGGQIAPLLRHKKAGELMNSLIEETNAYFNNFK